MKLLSISIQSSCLLNSTAYLSFLPNLYPSSSLSFLSPVPLFFHVTTLSRQYFLDNKMSFFPYFFLLSKNRPRRRRRRRSLSLLVRGEAQVLTPFSRSKRPTTILHPNTAPNKTALPSPIFSRRGISLSSSVTDRCMSNTRFLTLLHCGEVDSNRLNNLLLLW